MQFVVLFAHEDRDVLGHWLVDRAYKSQILEAVVQGPRDVGVARLLLLGTVESISPRGKREKTHAINLVLITRKATPTDPNISIVQASEQT